MGFSVDAGSVPSPPKIFPADIPQTENAAVAADSLGYNLSDANFAARFPGLVSARDATIKRDYENLTGPLNPAVQNSLFTGASEGSAAAFGGGSENPVATGSGTAGRGAEAAGYARNLLSFQDEARNNFEQDVTAFPERAFGLSGEGATNLQIANTANLNNANQLATEAKNAQKNANTAAANAQRAAITGAAVSTVGSVISAL